MIRLRVHFGYAEGFTLIEVMLGTSILTVALVALIGAFVSQSYLSANARALATAMNDATRVMEQIRLQNTRDRGPCRTAGIPTLVPLDSNGTPIPLVTSWNSWLESNFGGGKSVNVGLIADRNRLELVTVTCQDEDGGLAPGDYCGARANGPTAPAQIGAREWLDRARNRGVQVGTTTAFDPIRVTVAVGWRQGQRTIGGTSSGQEFVYAANTLTPNDANNNGVIESQAMLTTLVSCR